MGKFCAVKSCPSGRKTGKKTIQSPSFFQVTTPARLEKWKSSLGMPLKLNDSICHHHFKEEDVKMYVKLNINGEAIYFPTDRKTLMKEALPTIEHQFIPMPEIETKMSKINIIHVQESSKSLQNELREQHQHDIEDPLLTEYIETEYIETDSPIDIQYIETHTQVTIKPIDLFKNKIRACSMLPPFWLYAENPNGLEFMRMDPTTKQIKNHIRLNDDLSVTVIFPNKQELQLEEKINSYDSTHDYLKSVERWLACVGTQIDDNMFSADCKGVIIGDDTYERKRQFPRCKSCRILRKRLLNRGKKLQY